MIVVDLGCATYGGADSIGWLIDRYKPSHLYGFDPQGETGRGWGDVEIDGTHCSFEKKAAWLFNGQVGFRMAENASAVDAEGWNAPCFDLAAFVLGLGDVDVLKMDVEGAEYQLLGHLIRTGADKNIDLILVEWHRGEDRLLVDQLHCPVEEWTL